MDEPPRLGMVVPSTNTTVERELAGSLGGAVVHVTRVLQRETDDAEEKIATVLAMQRELDAATERLAGLAPRAVGFACTAASFLDGLAADLATCERLGARLGVPFLTASRAVASALGVLGVSRIALVTPYIEEVNLREVAYFDAAGIETVSASGLGIVGNLPKGRLPLSASADAVRALAPTGVDAVFVSCTNWLTLGNIAALEAELAVPVVSSNSALFWAMARAAGIGDRLPLGALGAAA